ncbi:MAG: phage DNA packaging protein J [Phycisphaerales bacterium]|nr:phage DNA packaging protein J [Phycisphaerales bacterium]
MVYFGPSAGGCDASAGGARSGRPRPLRMASGKRGSVHERSQVNSRSS